MKRWTRLLRAALPYALLLLLVLIALRDVFALPGVIGHVWDWDVSAFPSQLWGRLSHDLFIWDYEIRAGFYSPFRTSGWYSFLTLPLAPLGGDVYSKLMIAVLVLLAGICMRVFARGVLYLNAMWSTVAGILYMFAPIVNSRIMAGHSILLPYALLPLLTLCLDRTMSACENGRRWLPYAVATGVLLGLEGIHVSMMVLAFVVVACVILFALLRARRRVQIVQSATVMLALFGLLNIYWILPMGVGYLSSGTLYHSGSVTDNPDQVTATSVVDQRESLFLSSMQGMQDALRQNAAVGYDTEFIYPVPGALAPIWLIVSFLIPLAAFAKLLDRDESRDMYLVLAISGLTGATLVSGATLVTGSAIFHVLMLHALPVWAEFGNTVRAMPLVPFAFAALAPALMQELPVTWDKRLRAAATLVGLVAVLVYVLPFLSGKTLVDLTNAFALSLRSYQPSQADVQLYNWLKNDQADFRITYVPPPWIYHPENYDLGYEWTGGLSAHPEFFIPYFDPDVWLRASDFRHDIPASLSGKMLGLAAVKYVVYPRARFVNPSSGLYPPQPAQDNSARARFVDQVLDTQQNLQPVTLPLTDTLVFQNADYVPHIYAASRSILVQGSTDALPAVAGSSFFNGQPALFFSAQQSSTHETQQLLSQVDRLVTVPSNSALQTEAPLADPALIFPVQPPAAAAVSFSAPRAQVYTIRVQAAPFTSAQARPGDQTSASFALPSAGDVEWSGDLLFDEAPVSDGKTLQVETYLDHAETENTFVRMQTRIDPLNLAQYPILRMTSAVENRTAQDIAVELNLDLDGDGNPDVTWTSPAVGHDTVKLDEFNALALVRQALPDKSSLSVVGVAVRFEKRVLEAWEKAEYPARLYTSLMGQLAFFPAAANAEPGWSWQMPTATAPNLADVSLSLDNLDVLRFPILVDYRADGPAPLYAERVLTLVHREGKTQTVAAGSELIKPFARSTATLDLRDQLLQTPAIQESSGWRATRVDFVIHRLSGLAELRPTTFTLTRGSAARLPDTSEHPNAEPPTLVVDGKPVPLVEVPGNGPGMWYTTASLALTSGKHNLSAAFTGPTTDYAVESLEVEPVGSGANPPAQPAITFENINPTRYRIRIANATAPYFLVQSDNFNANWNAYIEPTTSAQTSGSQFAAFDPARWYEQSALLTWLFDGGKRSAITEHTIANGYANGWRVDKTGTYDIVLEFVPQRTYEGGLIVAMVTLLGAVVFLLAVRVRQAGERG